MLNQGAVRGLVLLSEHPTPRNSEYTSRRCIPQYTTVYYFTTKTFHNFLAGRPWNTLWLPAGGRAVHHWLVFHYLLPPLPHSLVLSCQVCPCMPPMVSEWLLNNAPSLKFCLAEIQNRKLGEDGFSFACCRFPDCVRDHYCTVTVTNI